MNEIASRYALALFSIYEDNKCVEEKQNEVKTIRKILEENPDFVMVLDSDFLALDDRIAILDKVFKDIDENLLALLKIIVRNGRTRQMDEVLQAFNSYCNAYRGVDEGLIYSIKPLDEKTKSTIEKRISEIENAKIELINKIDPELIGGVKVVIHDHIYDGSIKNQIEMMRKDLLKKEA